MSWYRDRAALRWIATRYLPWMPALNLASLLRSWTYSKAMPTLGLGPFELGVTPLAQWLILPPLALGLGRRHMLMKRRSP